MVTMQMQRMDSIPILCINAYFTIDTILKFDTDANVNIDAQCERTFIGFLAESRLIAWIGGLVALNFRQNMQIRLINTYRN